MCIYVPVSVYGDLNVRLIEIVGTATKFSSFMSADSFLLLNPIIHCSYEMKFHKCVCLDSYGLLLWNFMCLDVINDLCSCIVMYLFNFCAGKSVCLFMFLLLHFDLGCVKS